MGRSLTGLNGETSNLCSFGGVKLVVLGWSGDSAEDRSHADVARKRGGAHFIALDVISTGGSALARGWLYCSPGLAWFATEDFRAAPL
ncbi:MAG: hypothetical protein ACXVCT_20660 [Ktedonobacterales bacterium]